MVLRLSQRLARAVHGIGQSGHIAGDAFVIKLDAQPGPSGW
jgi:hypothetical protein